MILQTGLVGTASRVIEEKYTAREVKSGSLPVCATPVLSAVMEEAACAAIEGCLPAQATSVGIYIALKHNAPTLVGRTVTAKATLTETDGRKLAFHITAEDEAGPVGEADHVRCLIESAPFMEKAERRYRK